MFKTINKLKTQINSLENTTLTKKDYEELDQKINQALELIKFNTEKIKEIIDVIKEQKNESINKTGKQKIQTYYNNLLEIASGDYEEDLNEK